MTEAKQHLLVSQFRKIRTFVIILLLLFIANIFVNLVFDWGGLSPVVRVYIFLLSFLTVFNFANIDIEEYKSYYIAKYGIKGLFPAFFFSRVVPFLFVYMLTAVYTYVYYTGISDWFFTTFFSLLDGRHSNMVFYALILFVVLKIKKSPRFTIPVFLVLCVLFYYIDIGVYSLYGVGKGIGSFKFLKYFVISFVLIFDFVSDKKKIALVTGYSMLVALFLFFSVLGLFCLFYKFGDDYSYVKLESAFLIMKKGFSFPMQTLKSELIEKRDVADIRDLISYSKKFDEELNLPDEMWLTGMFEGRRRNLFIISKYLEEAGIRLDLIKLSDRLKNISERNLKIMLNSPEFIEYFSYYMHDNEEIISRIYEEISDNRVRVVILQAIAESGSKKYIDLIINDLTGMDSDFSKEVYSALKQITGLDPAGDMERPVNDPAVAAVFRRSARMMDREN